LARTGKPPGWSPRWPGSVAGRRPKGGCGKTTLATNLAVVLHDSGARRFCLVDLDLESGDIASTLGLIPARSLADAIPYAGEFDAGRIVSLMTSFRVGLDCLLAAVLSSDTALEDPKRRGQEFREAYYDYPHLRR
jgi:MinD-like ATPase involved in chromosome partitioning or flagellar assembly